MRKGLNLAWGVSHVLRRPCETGGGPSQLELPRLELIGMLCVLRTASLGWGCHRGNRSWLLSNNALPPSPSYAHVFPLGALCTLSRACSCLTKMGVLCPNSNRRRWQGCFMQLSWSRSWVKRLNEREWVA